MIRSASFALLALASGTALSAEPTKGNISIEPLLNFEWVTLNQIEHRDEEQR